MVVATVFSSSRSRMSLSTYFLAQNLFHLGKIDWQKLLLKEMKAPYVPKINAKVGISNDNFEPLMVNTDISTYKGKQDIFKDF